MWPMTMTSRSRLHARIRSRLVFLSLCHAHGTPKTGFADSPTRLGRIADQLVQQVSDDVLCMLAVGLERHLTYRRLLIQHPGQMMFLLQSRRSNCTRPERPHA